MDLFLKENQPNELSNELLTRAQVFREDPFSAKIKPEYSKDIIICKLR
jgi:hypothetical protein